MVKEEGLAARLHYDDHERRSGLVRFLDPAVDPRSRRDRRRARARRLPRRRVRRWTTSRPGQVSLSREGTVLGQPVGLSKTIRLARRAAGPGAGHRAGARTTAAPSPSRRAWAWSSRSTCWAAAATRRPGTTSAASAPRTTATGAAAGRRRDRLRQRLGRASRSTARPEPAADAWWSPIETVSNSESGFERVYQGSTLLLSWPVRLEPGETRRFAVRQAVTVARDHAPRRTRPGDDPVAPAAHRPGGRDASGRRSRACPLSVRHDRGRLVVHAHFYQPFRADPFTGRAPAGRRPPPRSGTGTRGSPPSATGPTRSGARSRTRRWDLGPTLTALPRGRGARRPRRVRGVRTGGAAARTAGPGIAQAFHHAILPLAALHDRRTEIRWGLRDFELRFGRPATAIWLPETAVDLATLRVMAEEGVQGTILAPWQADAPTSTTGARTASTWARAATSRCRSTTATCRASISFEPAMTADADRLRPRAHRAAAGGARSHDGARADARHRERRRAVRPPPAFRDLFLQRARGTRRRTPRTAASTSSPSPSLARRSTPATRTPRSGSASGPRGAATTACCAGPASAPTSTTAAGRRPLRARPGAARRRHRHDHRGAAPRSSPASTTSGPPGTATWTW